MTSAEVTKLYVFAALAIVPLVIALLREDDVKPLTVFLIALAGAFSSVAVEVVLDHLWP
jgi:hypothetical protein